MEQKRWEWMEDLEDDFNSDLVEMWGKHCSVGSGLCEI